MRKKPEWIRLRRSAKWCYTSGALLGGQEGGSVLPFFEAHDGHPAMEQVVRTAASQAYRDSPWISARSGSTPGHNATWYRPPAHASVLIPWSRRPHNHGGTVLVIEPGHALLVR